MFSVFPFLGQCVLLQYIFCCFAVCILDVCILFPFLSQEHLDWYIMLPKIILSSISICLIGIYWCRWWCKRYTALLLWHAVCCFRQSNSFCSHQSAYWITIDFRPYPFAVQPSKRPSFYLFVRRIDDGRTLACAAIDAWSALLPFPVAPTNQAKSNLRVERSCILFSNECLVCAFRIEINHENTWNRIWARCFRSLNCVKKLK